MVCTPVPGHQPRTQPYDPNPRVGRTGAEASELWIRVKASQCSVRIKLSTAAAPELSSFVRALSVVLAESQVQRRRNLRVALASHPNTPSLQHTDYSSRAEIRYLYQPSSHQSAHPPPIPIIPAQPSPHLRCSEPVFRNGNPHLKIMIVGLCTWIRTICEADVEPCIRRVLSFSDLGGLGMACEDLTCVHG